MKGTVWRWGVWFRVAGYGLNVHVHVHERPHLFSTRGLWHHVGPVCFRFLTPHP